jgi:Uma2 family endonuclease
LCQILRTAIKIAVKQVITKFMVFDSGQKVYFPALDEGVNPDTLAVCEKPIYWDDNAILLINPILGVEIRSKSTKKYDWAGKFLKYKTLGSFREYVLVEQDFCKIETFIENNLVFGVKRLTQILRIRYF